MTQPALKQLRGSYYPAIPSKVTYDVTTASGEVLYVGNSVFVARLVAACMTPRVG